MPNEKQRGRYDCALKCARLSACLTREELGAMATRLAEQDSGRFSPVSVETIKALELGWSRPRPKTAAALSKALGVSPAELFPAGVDDGDRRSRASEQKTQ